MRPQRGRIGICCMRIACVIVTIWLAGCGGASSSSRPAPCPPLEPYTAEEQDRAAAEVKASPTGSMLVRLAQDYGTLRSQIRAACL